MPLPLLQYQLKGGFLAAHPALPMESLWWLGATYCGSQASGWESSDFSWDNGDPVAGAARDSSRGFGKWHGPGALHVRPGALWIMGAAAEFLGHDDVARVSSGAPHQAIWARENPGFIEAEGGQWRVVLQDAGGAFLLDTLQSAATQSVAIPAFTGCAVLWVRLEGAVRGWALPPDYLSVRSFTSIPLKFRYTEAGTDFVWDYETDVGRRPADPGHPFYALYNALVSSGGLQHIGTWSQYIADGRAGGPQSGPWSALRIAAGAAPFAVQSGFSPAPGAILERFASTSTRAPVLVDPLGLSVSAFGVVQKNEARLARLGGTIATRDGPATAYWNFTPGASDALKATLLGTTTRNYVAVCEASLYPTVSDIQQAPDGSEWVLSYSHLYCYDPLAAVVTDALPGVPTETFGHPGGRCLRFTGTANNTLARFFTEFFGGVDAPVAQDAFAQFYNTLRTLDPSQGASTGVGTVFQGDNCGEVCFGKFYGWVQNKAFSDPAALQFLGYLESKSWAAGGLEGFPAAAFRWQRLRRVQARGGLRLLAAGKAAVTEAAIWGVADGQEFTLASLPFRARRLTRCLDETGAERIYAVGRFVTQGSQGAEVAPAWSVIALDGGFVKVCAYWNPLAARFQMSRVQAEQSGLDVFKLPSFLWWHVDAAQMAGGYWIVGTAAPSAETPYLMRVIESASVAYTLPPGGVLPYSVTSYDHFCLTVFDDGGGGPGPFRPEPKCQNARCVIDNWPGARSLVVEQSAGAQTWDAIQVSDVSALDMATRLRRLHSLLAQRPNLWLQSDENGDANDLSTYDFALDWNTFQALPRASNRIRICVIVPGDFGAFPAPSIDKRG